MTKKQFLATQLVLVSALITYAAANTAMAGTCVVLKSESIAGTLKSGIRVYVDDGSCGAGKILELRGGSETNPRTRNCIDRSKMKKTSRYCTTDWQYKG